MSNYEYSSFSSSSTENVGGANTSNALFSQVDANKDGSIDRGEFSQWLSGAVGGAGGIGAGAYGAGVAGAGGYGVGTAGSSSFESSYSSSGAVGDSFGVGAGLAGVGGSSSYESSSFSSGGALDVGSVGGAGFSAAGFDVATGAAGFDQTVVNQAASYTAETNAAWSKYGAEVRAPGLYVDANPQIIRRQAPGGIQTYTQNIKVRFLQPPPVPAPGPLIIKEVRPPQPPPLPPLVIKQKAPALPQPPPLILRERPPQPPAVQASQTVIRKLAALPVPPRSVVIERIAAPPPRPRDIIIERWVPYGAAAKRKTVVQRAAAAKAYAAPRNIIIQYEAPQVRVIRQFQKLGITLENPQVYVQRYGAQLLDAQSLVQQARAAGVVEDITPPAGSAVATSASFESSGASFGATGGSFGATGVEVGGFGAETSGASFTSSGFESSQLVGGGGFGVGAVGFDAGAGGAGFSSSSYESSSFSSSAGGLGVDAGVSGIVGATDLSGVTGYGGSSFESSSVSTGGAGGFDVAAAVFNTVDANKDGRVDANEFKQFVQGGL